MAKKATYKLGELTKLLDIQPYVLRYWETEFSMLAKDAPKSGQRSYSDEDVAILRRIKQLLYDEGYTIAGAKKKLDADLASEGGLSAEVEATSAGGSKGAKEASTAQDNEVSAKALDTRGAERIQMLRQGVEEALGEARELLAALDKP